MNSKPDFVAAAKSFQPLRDNCAARREQFLLRQFGDFSEVPASITARGMQEQILDGDDAEPGELRLARSPPTPQSDVTGILSGAIMFSGGDIARTIQTGWKRIKRNPRKAPEDWRTPRRFAF